MECWGPLKDRASAKKPSFVSTSFFIVLDCSDTFVCITIFDIWVYCGTLPCFLSAFFDSKTETYYWGFFDGLYAFSLHELKLIYESCHLSFRGIFFFFNACIFLFSFCIVRPTARVWSLVIISLGRSTLNHSSLVGLCLISFFFHFFFTGRSFGYCSKMGATLGRSNSLSGVLESKLDAKMVEAMQRRALEGTNVKSFNSVIMKFPKIDNNFRKCKSIFEQFGELHIHCKINEFWDRLTWYSKTFTTETKKVWLLIHALSG